MTDYMETKMLKPRKALNKAFLRTKANRTEIDLFKSNLILLIDRIDNKESEEFHKNLVSDFLKKTYYDPNHFINTKGRNDQVVHIGNSAKSPVGVIIEAKQPVNKAEMLSKKDLNAKALQELVLYYLRERITNNNLEIKYLIATNINEWFIFNSIEFEKFFAENKKLVKMFIDFEEGRLSGTKTDFFYNKVAKPFIEEIKNEIEFTYFDIRDYEKALRNDDKKDDSKLVALFKLLSPEHLLKLPFANDSNTLDKKFYSELLHIIGLKESKEKGKKIIGRSIEGDRNTGSILESAIIQLDSLDKISRLDNPKHFGETEQEQLFNLGLELGITWVDRILFLKLLEAQLITYHNGDESFKFLNKDRIKSYDDLNTLFFQVLAKKQADRNEGVKALFDKVPYLNSSLFEPTNIEHSTLFISNLPDDKSIPIFSSTVLSDTKGKKRKGELNTLEYLFEFLSAYDFSSEGKEEIQEENKRLINASVLGLIFEKINGYKDGSFFTPGFITMYMCRETIRRSVVQKFNDVKGWTCNELDDVYDQLDIKDRDEANEIVNSLKICDPAVGSGHFLVSALNEIIAIKHDLNILQDRSGRRLKEYEFEVVNDELIVTDEEHELYEYNPKNKESQRIQEALFHEKKTIIENCLFGVDINPNSVKICRLRLWIELLKNTYYKNETELETLPNIDINIKRGNSLISRFDLITDIREALKKSKWNITEYRLAVSNYRNAQSKNEKQELENIIDSIKSDFQSNISTPLKTNLKKARGQLDKWLTEVNTKKQWGEKISADLKQNVAKADSTLKKLIAQREEIKNNKIYENAFEWRFEFPEVLNDKGDFVGFDTVIGNPPYIRVQNLDSKEVDFFFSNFITPSGKLDISILFFEKALNILHKNGFASYISSSQWTQTDYGKEIRNLLATGKLHDLIDFGSLPVFEEADTYPAIFNFGNALSETLSFSVINKKESLNFDYLKSLEFNKKEINKLSNDSWNFSPIDLIEKLKLANIDFLELQEIASSYIGLLTGLDKAFVLRKEQAETLNLEKELLFPYGYRGAEISAFSNVKPNSLVIYPYQIDKNKSEVLISETELKDKYPNIHKYLTNYKSDLKKRKDSRKLYADGTNWYRHLRKGGFNLINSKKLLIKGVTTKMAAGILDKNAAFNGANCPAIILNDSSFSELYFLGLLNSKLISFFMNSICPKKLGGYFRYNAKSIDKIPIASSSPDLQNYLSKIVTEILDLKKGDPNADTSKLESKIDQLVYKLYELTEEEIKIVEESVK